MQFAERDNKRITASPGEKGTCPLCQQEMIAKCGDIKIWHWAHKSLDICDEFKEPETEWHRKWKEHFSEKQREVIIKKGNDYHIADIKNQHEMVIEFQNSPISFDDIRKRESFYTPSVYPNRMLWVFNCKDSVDKMERTASGIRWYAPKRNWKYCRQPVYLDCGSELFHVETKDVDISYDGDIPIWEVSGEFINKKFLIEKWSNEIPGNLSVCCSYKNGWIINYHVCIWYREDKNTKCEICEQWKYPIENYRRELWNNLRKKEVF